MDDITIRNGGKKYAKHMVRLLVSQLTGRTVDATGQAQGVFYAVGLAALSDIQDAFITKSRGGTGEDGVTWPPLTKEYLAYQRRFGPREKAALKKKAGLGKANQYGVGGKNGLLTKAQQKRWKQVYAQSFAWASAKYSESEAKGIAAGMAWNKIKAEGAKTMLEVYGNRTVDILRDTGVLFNSLSPGYLSGNSYEKPTAEGGDQQIFAALTDGIVIGTNVPYAAAHNYGYPEGGIPKREFLPSVIPSVWLERWAKVGVDALGIALSQSFQGAA